MGSSYKNHAPFALLISAALLGIVAIFIIFANTANSQLLKANKNYAENASEINNIRFGEHADKTRMVIDVNYPTDLLYKTSKDGKTIHLSLPKVIWHSLKTSPEPIITGEIISFSHTPLKEGSKITLKSSTPIIIKKPFFLPPKERNGHRIVIDFMTATAPIIDNTIVNTIATLDNIGATPNQTILVGQLNRQQNPYIQRAFPQKYPKRQNSNPTTRKSDKNALPSRLDRIEHYPKVKPAYPFKSLQKSSGSPTFNNLYVRGSVGMQLLDESSNDGNGLYDQEWDPGFILSSAIGTELETGFRAEGEFFYSNSSLKQVSGIWNGGYFNTEKVQGDISVTSLMGNIIYDFESNSRLTPYGLAGVGMSLLSLNDLKAINSSMANDMDLVASLQLGAGFTLDLDKRTKLDVGYRYFETQNPEFSDSTGTPYESVFVSHNFLLGARVELN